MIQRRRSVADFMGPGEAGNASDWEKYLRFDRNSIGAAT